MTIADLLKATQGLKLSDPVRIDVAGQKLDVLDFETSTELTIRAMTPHTVSMIAAQEANRSSLLSLQTAQTGWDTAKAQLAVMVAKRIQDYVDKGSLHVPPHGEGEAELLRKVEAGEI